jgi:hypothetical protein
MIIDTTVVNMHTTTCDVAIDRSSVFGNPFKAGTREEKIALYRKYFWNRVERDPDFRSAVLELRGKRLGCWCSPKPCHGMIIVEWLETRA